MNILFVADVSIDKVIGGAERVLFEQSSRLARRAHNVHILTRKLPSHKADEEIIGGVREWRYEFDDRNALSSIRSTWLKSKKLFERLHNQFGFDCINFHQPFSALGVVASPLSGKTRRIYTCHSLSFEEFKTRNPTPRGIVEKTFYFLNIQVRKVIERRVLNRCEKIIVLSQFTQEKLRRFHKITLERTALVPGGIDLETFYPVDDKTEIRRRLDLPDRNMILFTVRNLVSRMGLDNLIYALKHVVREFPDVYLVIGGEGPLKKSLIKLSQELALEGSVRFVGFIPERELPDYYRTADIFILPTIELEGFGLVTLEALASGIPVLGTPVGGTAEILGKLDPKYIFKDTKPESMASLITETCQQFRNNPRLWDEVSSQCRLFVEENYSWERNIDSLEELFQIS